MLGQQRCHICVDMLRSFMRSCETVEIAMGNQMVKSEIRNNFTHVLSKLLYH